MNWGSWRSLKSVRRCSAFEPAGSSNNCTASQPVWEAQLALASVGSWSGPVVQMFVWWGKHQVNDGPGKPDQSSTVVEHTGSIESWRLLRQINAILVVQVTPSLHSKPQCGLMILTATIFPMIFSKQHHCLLSTVWCFLFFCFAGDSFPHFPHLPRPWTSSSSCWTAASPAYLGDLAVVVKLNIQWFIIVFPMTDIRIYSGMFFEDISGRYCIYIYIYSIFWIHLLFLFNMESSHIAPFRTWHELPRRPKIEDLSARKVHGTGDLEVLEVLVHDGWDGLAFTKDYKVMETVPWSRLR